MTPDTLHLSPILVTGAHRSGTTWVGAMLAASGEAGYISEPLNVLHRPGVLHIPTRHWYTYICDQNQAEYLPALSETLHFRFHPWAEMQSLRSRKDLLRMGRDWSNFLVSRIRKKRPLLKDPFAVFSAPWFAEALGCQVVITVRHPAAFVSSLKRLNWSFDFTDLLAQPLLMKNLLEPFREEMEAALHDPADFIDQASLLWRIVYQVVARYQQQYPHIHVVRHEELSLNPLHEFRALYDWLGLHFTPRAQQTILESSASENPVELSQGKTHSVRLDSRANLHNWKRRLAPEEIAHIRRQTADIASLYYPEEDWG